MSESSIEPDESEPASTDRDDDEQTEARKGDTPGMDSVHRANVEGVDPDAD
jgi:hypothetical protein